MKVLKEQSSTSQDYLQEPVIALTLVHGFGISSLEIKEKIAKMGMGQFYL